MAFVERGVARIHWTSMGRGKPVVLIMGLGCSSAMWFRVAPVLARRHRVILLDNRGCGRTETPAAVLYRVADMAADVAAVLDAAGEPSAHVVGFSMGGMIAQQLAIDHAPRVRSLALLGTHSGGLWTVQPSSEVRQLLFTKDRMSHEEGLRAMRPFTYARATNDELFAEDATVRLANQPTARGYMAQLHGVIPWSAFLDLPRIACPTLVMHGLQDRLIMPANSRILVERIRSAKLHELDDASHWLMTDCTTEVNDALLDHLQEAEAA